MFQIYKSFIMPFGKYKGDLISEIQDYNYFLWLQNQNIHGNLKKCIFYKVHGRFPA